MNAQVMSTTTHHDFTAPDGRIVLQVRVDTHWDGSSVIVAHSDTLGRQFPTGTETELDAYLAFLERSANAGMQLCLIEDAASAHASAAAVYDDAERDLIASINQTMDAIAADRVNPTVEAIRADHATAQADRHSRIEQAIRNADQISADRARVQANQRHDYSRTRVGCQPPTPAELHAIRNHRMAPDGRIVVTAQPGQNWTTLRALHRRIPGQPTYKPGTLIITALTYRAEQLAGYLTQGCAA